MSVCYQGMGDVYFSSGRLPLAIRSFGEALRITEEAGNDAGMAAACTFLCNAHARSGEPETAIRYGSRALAIAEQLNDDRRIAWACVMLSQACAVRGEAERAREFNERGAELMHKTGDYRGIAWTSHGGTTSQARHYTGADWERARAHHGNLVEMAKSSGGFQHELASAFAQWAYACLRLEEPDSARERAEKALEVANPMSNKLESGFAHMVLAELAATSDPVDLGSAEQHLEQSLTEFTETDAKVGLGLGHLAGARIALTHHDYTKAREYARMAREMFERQGARAWQLKAETFLEDLPR